MASPGGAALTGPTRCEPVRGPGRPGKAPAATRQNNGATGNVPAPRCALAGLQLLCYFGPIALPVNCLRYGSHGAGRRTGGGQSPPPPVPPGSGQQHRRCACAFDLSLQASGRAEAASLQKHGPQPASMRAAPAFRERLSDVEAASTGSFQQPLRQR